MIDLFTIFGKGGLVLWCFQNSQQVLDDSVNALIKNVLLQERSNTSVYNHNGVTMKFKLDNEFELVFVVSVGVGVKVVYQSIVQLAYVDKLLSDVHIKFRDLYKNELADRNLIFRLCGTQHFEGFQPHYNKLLKLAQTTVKKEPAKTMRTYGESEKSQKSVASMIEVKQGVPMHKEQPVPKKKKENVEPKPANKQQQQMNDKESSDDSGNGVKNGVSPTTNDQVDDQIMKNREEFLRKRMGGGPAAKPAKAAAKKDATNGVEKKKGKQARVWDARMGGGGCIADAHKFDFSDDKPKDKHAEAEGDTVVEQEYLTQQREFVGTMKGELAGLDQDESSESELSEDEENVTDKSATNKSATSGGWFSAFRNLVGNKTLTREDVEPALDKLKDHLIGKNVAAEIAVKLCDSVAGKLEGKVLGAFDRINTAVREAVRESLTQILSPKRRVDILRDVLQAKQEHRPYVIVFCGVNGVGKSTNLAKITFWLNENGHKVLIAAGDTFRAGAVEQLRTHTRHLNALHPDSVQLYEQGYNKDPAGIAMHAISFATERKIDVVLVDTAGRMQDNEPLMRALSKLIKVNQPDLVLFVGEALVGNEAVDQLVKFNQALADHATPGSQAHIIDGILLTKFDTIDDKVGAAISMTYITGQPIVFVGTGQTYRDLKSLNADAVVKSLLK